MTKFYISLVVVIPIIATGIILLKTQQKKQRKELFDNLLYSLPTVSNEWGASQPTKSMENIFVILEDDWRQREFVSDLFNVEIDQEIDAIKNIYENYSYKLGFKEIHGRGRIPQPLKGKEIKLETIKKSFEIAKEYNGVAYYQINELVVSSFAFEATGLGVFWGQVDEQGIVLCMCLEPTNQTPKDMNYQNALNDFLTEHGLFFIDWCRVKVIKPI